VRARREIAARSTILSRDKVCPRECRPFRRADKLTEDRRSRGARTNVDFRLPISNRVFRREFQLCSIRSRYAIHFHFLPYETR